MLVSAESIALLNVARDKALEFLVNEKDIAGLHLQDYVTKLIKENVTGGKMIRGCTVLYVMSHVAQHTKQTPDLELGALIGIALEILHAAFLIADDIIDHSLTRRGKPCWYTREDVSTLSAKYFLYLSCLFLFRLEWKRSMIQNFYNK